tara:strand:+ start:839 stop:2119 length:1281 start_codon:yes stop_codon:yes gene_type:complete
MKLSDLLKFEEDLRLEKKTVIILRWIALLGQLFTVYIAHFYFQFELPIIYCSLTIFCGGVTNIFIQFNFRKNQLSNTESTILLFYDVIQLTLLLYLTGGVTNPFVIFLIVPAIVSSTLLNLTSTFFLSFITIISLLLITFNHYPLPYKGNLHFHVPEYYIYSIPISLTIVLLFLNYFGFRFGFEARKRGNALSKLESVLAKEQELDSIGHQAAAAAHSLGTPLSTINVIAKELRKEISNDKKYSEDIDILLEQARKCGEILKKISKREIVDDEYISNINIQDLLDEIVISFNQVTEKEIILNLKKVKKKFPIKRSPEITYGIRNFIGNAVKFSKKNVYIDLEKDGDEIKLIINDDGPGFPDDILKIVGEPYISSKNKFLKSKSGLGLGTFIGKTLLERKKAKIDFFNGVDGGAQVEISWNISDLKS